MKNYYYIVFATIVCLLTGCADQNFDWRLNRLSSYGKDFVSTYGWPDERKSWNTAMQYEISVETEMGGVWKMKAYTAEPVEDYRRAYLIGQHDINTTDGVAKAMVDGPCTLQSIFIGIEDGDTYAIKEVPTSKDGKIKVSFEEADLKKGDLPFAQRMSYIIAYEVVDSTSTFLDFNDIVLEVTYASGDENADVKLRAVGAEEKMSVTYKAEGNNVTLFDDAHRAFGYKRTDVLLNTESGKHAFFAPAVYNSLKVGKDFSIVKDCQRFVVTLKPKKGKEMEFCPWPDMTEYLGIPPYAMVISNPAWDWVSEGLTFEEKFRAFAYWNQSDHHYDKWWDNIWDPHELVLCEDGSFQPDFNYVDKIFGIADIEKAKGIVPDISYLALKPYLKEEIGANISFVICDRRGGNVDIYLTRSDGGDFEWYDGDVAYVNVYDNINIDNGEGYAEACHILLSTKTIQQIVDNRLSLRVTFDKGETNATINSVWVRGR